MEKIFFNDVGLSFGQNEIFKNVTLEISSGKIIGVAGKNGAGKSTFLKLAAKIIKPDTGEIKIDIENFRKKIAAVTPEMKIYNDLTAKENLKFFSKLRGKTLTEENFFELGRRVGLNFIECGKIRVGNFSTGMKQRLKFAILLSVDAKIWLLDEPTSNLDDGGKKIFLEEIRGGVSDERIILLATNDKTELKICDEIINLPFG